MPLTRDSRKATLHGGLSTVEYFTFGFGTMIGVGWLVLMDDWLTRGGPGGGMLGFLIGGLLLFPDRAHLRPSRPAHSGCRRRDRVHRRRHSRRSVSFAAGWTMVLSYAIVCPWEAVATGQPAGARVPGAEQLSALCRRRQPDLRAAARGRPGAHAARRRS